MKAFEHHESHEGKPVAHETALKLLAVFAVRLVMNASDTRVLRSTGFSSGRSLVISTSKDLLHHKLLIFRDKVTSLNIQLTNRPKNMPKI
jgi:Protein of unknown function (DUF3759)